jgi:hypothetical protein
VVGCFASVSRVCVCPGGRIDLRLCVVVVSHQSAVFEQECKIRLLHPSRKPIVLGAFKGVSSLKCHQMRLSFRSCDSLTKVSTEAPEGILFASSPMRAHDMHWAGPVLTDEPTHTHRDMECGFREGGIRGCSLCLRHQSTGGGPGPNRGNSMGVRS